MRTLSDSSSPKSIVNSCAAAGVAAAIAMTPAIAISVATRSNGTAEPRSNSGFTAVEHRRLEWLGEVDDFGEANA